MPAGKRDDLDVKHVETMPPHQRAHEELQRAEEKISEGVKQLYDIARQRNVEFDGQGISTVELKPEELKHVAHFFPNGLQNGVTLHVFREGFIQHPPIEYMISQKVKSLCDAAAIKFHKDIPVELASNALTMIQNNIRQSLQQKLHQTIEKEIQQNFEKKRTGDMKKVIRQTADALMKDACEETLRKLYALYSPYRPSASLKEDVKQFSKEVIQESIRHPSNTRDTLTFSSRTNRFSYNEGTKVTAHDRGLNRPCANLGLCVDGVYTAVEYEKEKQKDSPKEFEFRVTSSIVGHASLPPIDAIAKKANEMDVVVDTCFHAKEVLQSMARLRLHGRDAKEKGQPMSIDWGYLLLTTNIFDNEDQRKAFLTLLQALPLIDGMSFKVGETVVTGNMSVMNVGINTAADWEHFSRFFTPETVELQKQENRRSYLRASDAIVELTPSIKNSPLEKVFGDKSPELDREITALQYALTPSPLEKTLNQKDLDTYQELQKLLKENQQEFTRYSNTYHQSEKKEKATHEFRNAVTEFTRRGKDLHSRLDVLNQKIETHRLDYLASQQKNIATSINNIRGLFQDEKIKKELSKILTPVAPITDEQKLARNKAFEQLRAITALFYKDRIDQLYFPRPRSGKQDCQMPELGAAFTAQLAAYNRLTGRMASTGCKSRNDRTFIMRLFLSAMESRDLVREPFPPRNLREPNLLTRVNQDAISNSAMFACINDTGGGTPKVDIGWFNALVPIADKIKKFGKYAAHKMKKVSEPTKRLGVSFATWLTKIFEKIAEFFKSNTKKAVSEPAKAGMFAHHPPLPTATPAAAKAAPAATPAEKEKGNEPEQQPPSFQTEDPRFDKKI